MEEVQD